MDRADAKKLTANCVDDLGTGCVFLFLQSDCPDLLSAYNDPEKKFSLFKVIKLTLSDATGSLDGYEILKLHDADPRLGVEIKFGEAGPCRRFLESYRSGAVQQLFAQHASRVLPGAGELVTRTQLKTGDSDLDDFLHDQDHCLHLISLIKPDRLPDDEVCRLEQELRSLILSDRSSAHTTEPPTCKQEAPSVPSNCFLFQERLFDDRQLTPADHQRFATNIGRSWKKVGRELQKTCRALKGPAIENLAYEYERDGLYEQAYQLLGRFIQAEGKGARLGRLVRALEEIKLTGVAEIMLDIHPKE